MRTTVMTLGRFTIPHKGHSLIFNKMVDAKREYNADRALVFTTHTQDGKKNPLHYDDKILFLQEILHQNKELEVVKTPAKQIIQILQEIEDDADRLVLIVGGDRISEFETLLNKYNGKEYNFEDIVVLSAGDRDPDSEGVDGMSASKLRTAAIEGDFETFKSGIDSENESLIMDLYDAVRTGMGIKEADDFEKCLMLLREAEIESPEQKQVESEYLSRIKAFLAKAGVTTSAEDTKEVAGPQITPNEAGDEIKRLFPDNPVDSYKGTSVVLFIDNVVGTKFITRYIGNFYEVMNDALDTKMDNFRIVIRQLRELDNNEKKEKLMNLKIAWSSTVGNPAYAKKRSQMKIDFAIEDTVDVLKNIAGEKVYVASIGALNQKGLEEYVAKFESENEKVNGEKPIKGRLDTTYVKSVISRFHLTPMSSNAISKEREAADILAQFVNKGDELKKEEVNKFSEKYGVDKQIIANYLQVATLKKSQIENDDKEALAGLTKDFSNQLDALGLKGVFKIGDIIKTKNFEANRELEADSESPIKEYQRRPPSSLE